VTSEEIPQGSLARGPGVPQRATLLELFFDVVFVAAIAVTSAEFSQDISWHAAVRAIVPLMAIWWIWVLTTLLTDFYDPEQPPVQVILAGTMLGTVLAAVSAPQAFGTHGLFFAAAYVAVHLGRGALLTTAIPDRLVKRQAARFLFWFCVSAVPWLLGGLVHPPARGALWGAALVVDYAAAALRYPAPWLGPVPLAHYRQAREHLGERYRQFIILALGDMILVATLRYSQVQPTTSRTGAFLLAFVTAALLWQIFIVRGGSAVLVTMPRRAGGSARWGPYTHVTMVIGIVAMSAAFEVVIQRPGQPPPAAWVGAIAGGAALFVAGRIVFDYVVFFIFSRSRTVWLVLLIAVAPLMVSLPSLVVVVIIAVILLGITVTDHVRLRIRAGRIASEVVDPRQQRGITGS
jgi:low temperature requirement protein LtrA